MRNVLGLATYLRQQRFLIYSILFVCLCILVCLFAKSTRVLIAALLFVALLAIVNAIIIRRTEKYRESAVNRANEERKNIGKIIEQIISSGGTEYRVNQIGNYILEMFGYRNLCVMVEIQNNFHDYYWGEYIEELKQFKDDIIKQFFTWPTPKTLPDFHHNPVTLSNKNGDSFDVYGCAIIKPKRLSGGRRGHAALINYRSGAAQKKSEEEISKQLLEGTHPLYPIAWLLIEHIIDYERAHEIESVIYKKVPGAKNLDEVIQIVVENIKPLLNFSQADFIGLRGTQEVSCASHKCMSVPVIGKDSSVLFQRDYGPEFTHTDYRLGERFLSLAVTVYEREEAFRIMVTHDTTRLLRRIIQIISKTHSDAREAELKDAAERATKYLTYCKYRIAGEIRSEELSISQLLDDALYIQGLSDISKAEQHTRDKNGICIKAYYRKTKCPPGYVYGDKVSLFRTFLNILQNAEEAVTGSNVKEIGIEVKEEEQNLIISISDTGCGIPHEIKAEIWGKSFKEGGSGFGLSYAQKVVEMHGGSISAESEGKGKGATFVITLPKSVQRVESVQ